MFSFANFATLYSKFQFKFGKAVCLNLEKSLLFTEINNQNDENFRRDKMAGL